MNANKALSKDEQKVLAAISKAGLDKEKFLADLEKLQHRKAILERRFESIRRPIRTAITEVR